jgi:UDP-N-acetylmuramoyl-tripeptide--D-alanyl-D-alanine ligase
MTMYNPLSFGKTVAYMLQNVEYQPKPYVAWLLRTRNFDHVMYRRTLAPTKASKLFSLFVTVGAVLQSLVALVGITLCLTAHNYGGALLFVALLIATPVLWSLAVCVPLVLGRILVANPKEKRLIAQSKFIFGATTATKIAVAGSYGKTTMKELLGTVLSQGKRVAITPANKNVAISHALFARALKGDEEVLVIELGEGQPGDVARFTNTISPDIGVIAGIAPAHLDHYPSLQAAADDIFSLTNNVQPSKVYINGDSPQITGRIKPQNMVYTQQSVGMLKAKNIKVTLNGMQFNVQSGKNSYKLTTKLVGRHLIGTLMAVIAIAESLGLTKKQIQDGVALTTPFEHRMQPRQLASGAWLIDDTYNGNIEGIRVGLALLTELTAKRKIYVTPGLVDQGDESENIHRHMGQLIAAAQPDVVVLMQNSVTNFIQQGITTHDYQGELRIESDPLAFYNNIEHFVAAGDVILMQNDWPDNYA